MGYEQKQQAIQALMEQHGLDALYLTRASSFAWATDGSPSYINTASSFGEASLLITQQGKYLIANNIEAERLDHEEHLKEQGWQFQVAPWYQPNPALADLTHDLRVGADTSLTGAKDLSSEVSHMRANLNAEEDERFRTLGRWCAQAMDEAIHAASPGLTEYEIAALLGEAAQKRGAQPIVNLIATDERIYAYRHPLPTDKKLDRYAMLVLCGRWKGLVASITRLVYFGKLPDELREKEEATARVDAVFISRTRPGRALGEVFADAQAAYAAAGFKDEWQLHHQGGPAGYEPREWVATPGMPDKVLLRQAYAWNPSITGTKSEDTILVGEQGNEVITTIEGWPMLTVTLDDGTAMQRPAILEA